MDILHLAAPCRNVPVTFTLDRMESPAADPNPHPRAVLLARVFLFCVGALFLVLAAAMWFDAVDAPAWWAPVIALGIGVALFASAVLEKSAGVVATFLIFFFPWT